MKKVLIVGNGGREHALAWKVAQSEQVEQVYVASGNAGTAGESKTTNIAIDPLAINDLIAFAKQEHIDLTIIGPEAPLAKGIVDLFQQAGLACFGPTQRAAQLESSKAFSKDFMLRYNIPTAVYATFDNVSDALSYLDSEQLPLVIKADGLAAGKGVFIIHTKEEGRRVLADIFTHQSFGEAGNKVVIEQFLEGEEASYIVMVDGKNILPLATSQDHKARDNADRGPNTGGMGAYSPAPVVTPEIEQRILQTVIEPTVAAMAEQGSPYTGFLYAGVMIDQHGQPKVLEFNCRFGDPETQPILMRLQSDLVELCEAALEQKLSQISVTWSSQVALGVVMCAGGYPEQYNKGEQIDGLTNDLSDVKVFHAGTQLSNNNIVTNGGRVLCVTALGDTVGQAQQKAYDNVKKISWQNSFYRTDIGYRAVAREKRSS